MESNNKSIPKEILLKVLTRKENFILDILNREIITPNKMEHLID